LGNKLPNSLYNLANALESTIKSMYALAPAAVLVGLVLAVVLILMSLWFSDITIIIIVLIVIGVSIFIYANTRNYGEASLALVVGLLAAFTVEWKTSHVILFIAAWFWFSSIILLFRSIKLAADVQDIFTQAAIWIDSSNIEETKKQLDEISKSCNLKIMGPIDRAKAMRTLTFHKLPLGLMKTTLGSIEQIAVVTKIDYEKITTFHSNIYEILGPVSEETYHSQIERIFKILLDTPAPPEDFFDAFKRTRNLAMSGKMDVHRYFEALRTGFKMGIDPEEMYEYMAKDQE
jgi:hypothetical protein